eukprot:scaffold40829_cov52-Phaeocystis_antarctica.AAC.2
MPPLLQDRVLNMNRLHDSLRPNTLKPTQAVTDCVANRTMPASRFLRTICNETLCSGHASEARMAP